MSSIVSASPWDHRPLDALIDHIIARYHRPLPAALSRLQAKAARVPSPALAAGLTGLRELLAEHTRREEELVFPWLRGGRQRSAGVLVSLLEHEHGDVERRVLALRELAEGERAIAPVLRRELTDGLRALDRSLAAHLRLENRVLFPRALVGVVAPD